MLKKRKYSVNVLSSLAHLASTGRRSWSSPSVMGFMSDRVQITCAKMKSPLDHMSEII